MKKNKAIISLLICVILVFAQTTPVLASAKEDETVTPQDTGYYIWRVKSSSKATGSYILDSNYTYYTTSEKSTAGETVTQGVTYTESYKLNGTLKVTVKQIEASLGITLSNAKSISNYVTSRLMNQGERVSSFYVTRYYKYTVVQEYGYQLHGDFYPTGDTMTVYVYDPVPTASIHLCYHYTDTPNCTHTP